MRSPAPEAKSHTVHNAETWVLYIQHVLDSARRPRRGSETQAHYGPMCGGCSTFELMSGWYLLEARDATAETRLTAASDTLAGVESQAETQ
ncbi:hypothetical protein F2P81_014811 [Scophthalmus maximus]|uniref:Uncharacterized protein n=1 Tax=Scophthalmus maximus TaxID=52904 RepID=A0A6A4SN47_SCOMX|nr:hypothetical protein F2P81_014811 [Scophthalmus maximus]